MSDWKRGFKRGDLVEGWGAIGIISAEYEWYFMVTWIFKPDSWRRGASESRIGPFEGIAGIHLVSP